MDSNSVTYSITSHTNWGGGRGGGILLYEMANLV